MKMMLLPSEQIQAIGPEELRAALSHGPVQLTFTKQNGLVRWIRGTTCPSLIPEGSQTQSKPAVLDESTGLPKAPKPQDPELFVIWDLGLGAWRSFRYASLLSVLLNTLENPVSLPI